MKRNKKLLSAALGLAMAGSLNLGVQHMAFADEGQQTYEAVILHNTANNTYKIDFTNTLPGGYKPVIILNGADNPDLITGDQQTFPVTITGDAGNQDIVLDLGSPDKKFTFKESQLTSNKTGVYNYTDNSLSPAPPESPEYHPSTIPGENGTPGYPSKQDKEKEKETPVTTSPTAPTTDGHGEDSSPVEDPSSVPGEQPQDESHNGVEGAQDGGETHSPVSGAQSGEETTHEDSGVAGQPGEVSNHEDNGVQPPASQEEPPVAGQDEHPGDIQSDSPSPEGEQHQGSTEDGAKQEEGNKGGSPAAEKNEEKDNSQAAGPSTENNQQENKEDGSSDAEHSKQESGAPSTSEAAPGTTVSPEDTNSNGVNNDAPSSQDSDSQGPKVDSEQQDPAHTDSQVNPPAEPQPSTGNQSDNQGETGEQGPQSPAAGNQDSEHSAEPPAVGGQDSEGSEKQPAASSETNEPGQQGTAVGSESNDQGTEKPAADGQGAGKQEDKQPAVSGEGSNQGDKQPAPNVQGDNQEHKQPASGGESNSPAAGAQGNNQGAEQPADEPQANHQEENQPAEGDQPNQQNNPQRISAKEAKIIKSMQDASVSTWMAEQNDVHKRLGELHYADKNSGLWARTYGGKFTNNKTNYQGNYHALQVGYDTKVQNSPWLVGLAGSIVKANDARLQDGKADTELKGLTVYGTMQGKNNDYLDLVAKFSKVKTDFTLGAGNDVLKTNTKANGFSFSAEYGRKFQRDNGFYVEPQVELRYSHLGDSTAILEDDFRFNYDSLNMFTSRLGVNVGKQLGNGHIYSGIFVNHNFGGNSNITVTHNKKSVSLDNDYSGTYYTVNLGATYKIGLASNMYANIEKSFGGTFKVPYRYDLGFRFNF